MEITEVMKIEDVLVKEGAKLYIEGESADYVPNKTRIMQFKSSGIGTVYIDDFKCYN